MLGLFLDSFHRAGGKFSPSGSLQTFLVARSTFQAFRNIMETHSTPDDVNTSGDGVSMFCFL